MYTRCPSCRAEISFEPPANLADLPENYKHRIKCPSCGVTIAVKIPRQEAVAQTQPTFTPQNTNAKVEDNNIEIGVATPTEHEAYKATKAEFKEKKSGRIRNFFIFIFSAIIVAINALAYLGVAIPKVGGVDLFNGIAGWEMIFKDAAAIGAAFGTDIMATIISLLPMILFTLAGVSALIALISFIGGKYSRAFNFIFSLLILAVAVVNLFAPVIVGLADIKLLFASIIEGGLYMAFIVPGVALLQFVFALIFCKSMKANPDVKRPKKPKKQK